MKSLSPKVRFIFILLILIFPAACVTPPNQIRAKRISPIKYQNYTCEQIKQELFLVDYKLFQLTMHQNMELSNQKNALGSSFLSVFLLLEDNKNEEIAQLKGEFEALEYVAKQKECKLDTEVEEVNTELVINQDN
jgi:hypothetical protein